MNEAVTAVARVEGGLQRITFGVIPLGTGNDFGRRLGLPEDGRSRSDCRGRTVWTKWALLTRALRKRSAAASSRRCGRGQPALKTVAATRYSSAGAVVRVRAGQTS